jgi:hypothetical protein
LEEMENILIQSEIYSESAGFPYASNAGTVSGAEALWQGADTEIAISGGIGMCSLNSVLILLLLGATKIYPRWICFG